MRATERVVSELAHDIRTPLTGIIALAELLAASELGERERQWVAALRNSADHLATLTTLVVDAAKTRKHELEPLREPFDPRVLASAAAASLATRAEGAGLACQTEISAELPPIVIGDAVRLRAALENLIENAVKFTERGSVGLKVTAQKHARGERLEFAVSDSGIGLSAAEIKRLFRPFSQAHEGIARRFGGAGLGLSLVKRLARAMGGDLEVESAPGKGSTFMLSVQLGVPKAGKKGRAETASAGAARPLAVLYVEDNPYARVVMNAILTGLGHYAEFAGSAEAALTMLKARPFDLVLMDISLIAIDGIEATRQIRALSGAAGKVPVIGISGHDDAAKARAAHAAGMAAYLIKPVSPRGLADAISAAVGRSR